MYFYTNFSLQYFVFFFVLFYQQTLFHTFQLNTVNTFVLQQTLFLKKEKILKETWCESVCVAICNNKKKKKAQPVVMIEESESREADSCINWKRYKVCNNYNCINI